MKIIKIGIMSSKEIKRYSIAIAKGEIKPLPNSPKIFFASEEEVYRRLRYNPPQEPVYTNGGW